MAKLTLTDLENLNNQVSAVTNINANNSAIETAMDNTLSRDGTSPNQMEANLDMNSHRILNLPLAASANEPLRLQELADFVNNGVINFPSDAANVIFSTSGTTITSGNVQGAIEQLDDRNEVPDGTSGGIVYYSGSSTVSSSPMLTQYGVVIGGGTGGSPSALAAGTNGQLILGQTGTAPVFTTASGDLTINASGVTTIAANAVSDTKIRQGAARTVIGVTGNATTNVADIQGSGNQVLRVNSAGTSLAFGQVNLSSASAVTSTLALANGGLAASLTASAGGIFYSTATAGAILAGTATAGQALLSTATAPPVWSTTTYPSTASANVVLYANTANNITGLASTARGVLTTNSSSVPSFTVGQIPGTATNDSASAGNIGEVAASTVTGPIALTTAVSSNVTNVSLTAGDWDIEAAITWTGSSTTTATILAASVSTASGTLNFLPGNYAATCPAGTPFASANIVAFPTGRTRVSLTATTTFYAVAFAQFGVATCSVYGILQARRVR